MARDTTAKETIDLNQFRRFAQTMGESRELWNIPAPELNKILATFFRRATTVKGELYEPNTLSSFFQSFHRILEAKGSKVNIRKSDDFIQARAVLSNRRKELTKQGKGNRPNACRPLTPDEVDHLYSVGFFGDHDAKSLYRTVWWKLTTQFGYRARDETR